jgi:hypothetical protein
MHENGEDQGARPDPKGFDAGWSPRLWWVAILAGLVTCLPLAIWTPVGGSIHIPESPLDPIYWTRYVFWCVPYLVVIVALRFGRRFPVLRRVSDWIDKYL